MYIFTKKIDETNPYDKSEVQITIPEPDSNLDDVVQVFEDFLKACGFSAHVKLDVSYTDEE